MTDFDLIIAGAGPAGLSAARAAYEQGITSIALLDRLPEPGGMLPQCFHRGFGEAVYGEELTGPEFIHRLMSGFPRLSIFTGCTVTDIGDNCTISAAGGIDGVNTIRGKALILATGCRERPAGHLPIYGTRPAGVFTAGSVQRMINLGGYRFGKKAVVLGSGDVGMIVAHHLTQTGTQVLAVIEKSSNIGGLVRNRRLYIDSHGIPVITGSTVTELHGENRLSGVTVCKTDKNENPIPESGYRMDCDTLITSVGLIPELELVRGLPLAFENGLLADANNARTNLPWLFVCGNARRVHSLVDSVVIQGRQAGIAASEYLRFIGS